MTATKIALFVRSVGGGGAQRVMVRYANGLVDRGFVVELLALRDNGVFRGELDPRVQVRLLGPSRLALAAPAIARYLREGGAEVLMTTEPACNVVVLLAKKMARSATRVVIREGLFPSVARARDPHLATRLAYWLSPWIYPEADGVVAIATDMAGDLAAVARLPPERITTIPVNPVVTPGLLAAAAQTPDHPWLQPEAGRTPVLLGVGRLEPQKGFDVLIAAFEKVRATRPCRLVIYGEGPKRGELAAQAARSAYSQDIDLPGFTASPYAAMAACDLFVLSSRYEGLPNALMEALACGAPVVSADCMSGPRDVLDGGAYGVLVPVEDAGAMAAAILRQLDTTHDRDRQRRRGLEYTLERSIDRYLPVLLPDMAKAKA